VVGAADPLPVATKGVQVRPSTKRSRCEGRDQLTGIQGLAPERLLVEVKDHAAAMRSRVGPIACRLLGPLNEDHTVVDRTGGNDPNLCVSLSLMQDFHSPRWDVYPLDTRTVEDGSRRITPHVVDNPLAVVKPAAAIRENVIRRNATELAFVVMRNRQRNFSPA